MARNGESSWATDFHRYLAGNQGQIMCLFPGQFIALEESNLKPGDRIKMIQSKAPDLITVFPNGLSILYGHTKEIEEKLGLFYS